MLLSLSETLGELAKNGKGPKRSILIGHWDAEEHGVLGSSEWVEQMREQLEAKALIGSDRANRTYEERQKNKKHTYIYSYKPHMHGHLVPAVWRSHTYLLLVNSTNSVQHTL